VQLWFCSHRADRREGVVGDRSERCVRDPHHSIDDQCGVGHRRLLPHGRLLLQDW